MDFNWVAIALGDVAWISLAFVLGLLSRLIGLPPLVGFLAAGFFLSWQGFTGGEMLLKLSDLGITLLLFTVGLKLNLRSLARPQIWAVTGIHTSLWIAACCCLFYGLALAGASLVPELSFQQSLLIAFALSFSSTVFVVKVLEEKGEMTSVHGRIAIGILIMQDIAAVAFLAISAGKWPSIYALAIVLLIPLRPLLHRLLEHVGHGELLVLYGFLLALGGAEVFEIVGLKGDLGALILGVMIANHPKSEEIAKTMLGFKDLFLIGFFLSIGMSGTLTWDAIVLGALITPLIFFKSLLFFVLMTRFKLRARTSLLATVNLTNFSEFGLIVLAVGVANGWIANEWQIILAVALSMSFAIGAGLSKISHSLYAHYREQWRRYQVAERLAEDQLVDIHNASVVIIGMGGVGTGAYDKMREAHGDAVVGIDIDPITVENQVATGRRVLLGDPSDADFWDRVQETHKLNLILLALPRASTILSILSELKETSYAGKIAATARFEDEVEPLLEAGATTVFNVYTEAGSGFASHVLTQEA
jgi:predicted Kef-type K+ transport protein